MNSVSCDSSDPDARSSDTFDLYSEGYRICPIPTFIGRKPFLVPPSTAIDAPTSPTLLGHVLSRLLHGSPRTPYQIRRPDIFHMGLICTVCNLPGELMVGIQVLVCTFPLRFTDSGIGLFLPIGPTALQFSRHLTALVTIRQTRAVVSYKKTSKNLQIEGKDTRSATRTSIQTVPPHGRHPTGNISNQRIRSLSQTALTKTEYACDWTLSATSLSFALID